jgi:hypothetical protein
MSNSGRRSRSRTLMLVPNLRPKVVPHDGSRLLLGLIVRAGGRLVEGLTLFGAAQGRPSGAACRLRAHHPGHPRPVASLEKRARFLALLSSASELLLPDPLCSQSQFNRRVRALQPELRDLLQRCRVGLRFQGGTFGQPGGRDLRLRPGGGGLRREAHRRLPHRRGPP